MSHSSNFLQAMRDAKREALVGPNVIAKALPYLGAGLVLTAIGTYGGLGVINAYPGLFIPTFWVALIAELVLYFVALNIAEKEKSNVALPVLALYSLLSGYTLSGLVYYALATPGVGMRGVGIAAFGCGVTFILARQIGSNLSEEDSSALTKTVQLGIFALVIVLGAQLLFAVFGVYTPTWLEIGISGIGVFLFVGAAVVDFYILPRTYRDDQYLTAALSMYLTYINLFIFILRFVIALSGGGSNRE